MALGRRDKENRGESDGSTVVQRAGHWLHDPKRRSSARIYETMMRSGGEPFGAPFESGLASLTSKVVRFFRLAGFFGFETIERLGVRNRRNKFTRHGAAPYTGDHAKPPASGKP